MGKHLLYAQSGGATAVINHTAKAVIESSKDSSEIGKVFCAKNGILGVLHEDFWDVSDCTSKNLNSLSNTPGAFFGSCRFKLPPLDSSDLSVYERILKVCLAHDIGYIIYNGGNDSQDTTKRLHQFFQKMKADITIVGAPKTIDNDLFGCDVSPGFISASCFSTFSLRALDCDLIAMAKSSSQVFLMEVMGRHTGWLAASCAASKAFHPDLPPHLVLIPERKVHLPTLLLKTQEIIKKHGRAVIVVAEGVKLFLKKENEKQDAFGHQHQAGVVLNLAKFFRESKIPCQWSVASYLQRSAVHLRPKLDMELAYSVGTEAVRFALEGKGGNMVGIRRIENEPISFAYEAINAKKTAGKERIFPAHFLKEDGTMLTREGLEYFSPLMKGEIAPINLSTGIPDFAHPKTFSHQIVQPKLPSFTLN